MAPACVDPSHFPFTLCRPTPGWRGVKKKTSYIRPIQRLAFVRSFVRSACWLLIALFPLSSSLTALVWDSTWVAGFLWRFFEYPPKWCTYSTGIAGATWNCCRLGMFCVLHTTLALCHFMQSHIRKVHACLAVTCHLHFWQNVPGSFRCYSGNTGMEQILK